jgi:hypothetical protein
MSVYVDDLFVGPSWGKWEGGGHMQADTLEELHAFAARLGLRRSWFQRSSRAELSHYDVTRGKREQAIRMGAIAETWREAARRSMDVAAPTNTQGD